MLLSPQPVLFTLIRRKVFKRDSATLYGIKKYMEIQNIFYFILKYIKIILKYRLKNDTFSNQAQKGCDLVPLMYFSSEQAQIIW